MAAAGKDAARGSSAAAPFTGTLKGHKDSVLCLDTKAGTDSPDLLLSGSEDGTARLWDLRSRKSVRCLAAFNDQAVASVAFGVGSSDNNVFAAAGSQVSTFDMRRPEIVLRVADDVVVTCADEANQVAVHPTGDTLCVADDSGDVSVLSLPKEPASSAATAPTPPSSASSSSTASDSGGCSRVSVVRRHSNICSCVCWRGRGKEAVSGGMDHAVVSWDAGAKRNSKPFVVFSTLVKQKTNKQSQSFNPPFVHALAAVTQPVDPSLSKKKRQRLKQSQLIGAGLGDGRVSIFEFKGTVRAPVAAFQAHRSSVTTMSWLSPHSLTSWPHLLSAGTDQTVVLWDVSRVLGANSDDDEKMANSTQASGDFIDSQYAVASWPLSHKPNWVECASKGSCAWIADTSAVIRELSLAR